MVISTLGHSLGLDMVAEGVETEEQLEFQRSQGCNRVRGFYDSKPAPEAEISRLMRENTRADQAHAP